MCGRLHEPVDSPPMRMLRRPIALLAILMVAWTALWPLVSSLHAAGSSEPVPLCHMAGMEVAPGMAPDEPGTPGETGKTHCPLCIMAFYGAFAAAPHAPAFVLAASIAQPEAHGTPRLSRFEPGIPLGRAPPLFS